MKKLRQIKEYVGNLNFQNQLVYLYLISKRHIKNYVLFSQKADFGNPETIRNAVNLIRKAIFEEIPEADIEQKKEAVENVSPDLDVFPGDMASSFAMNTCSIVYDTLIFIQDKDSNLLGSIIDISVRSLETYLEETLSLDPNLSVKETEAIIETQELMQEELKFQENLVNTLYLMRTIDSHFLELVEMIEDNISDKIAI